jgi:hypothetical protein
MILFRSPSLAALVATNSEKLHKAYVDATEHVVMNVSFFVCLTFAVFLSILLAHPFFRLAAGSLSHWLAPSCALLRRS